MNAYHLEQLFDAACQFYTDMAAKHELDVVRHERFSKAHLATTSMGNVTRDQAFEKARLEATRCTRLAELARDLREKCHSHNLSSIIAQMGSIETKGK
jgi:hypothetical protein